MKKINKKTNKKKVFKSLPAIPPDDYEGTEADWMVGLQQRRLWSGKGWYGEIFIPEAEYKSLLKECEAK